MKHNDEDNFSEHQPEVSNPLPKFHHGSVLLGFSGSTACWEPIANIYAHNLITGLAGIYVSVFACASYICYTYIYLNKYMQQRCSQMVYIWNIIFGPCSLFLPNIFPVTFQFIKGKNLSLTGYRLTTYGAYCYCCYALLMVTLDKHACGLLNDLCLAS